MKKWQKVLLGTAGVLGACAWLWWQDEPLAPQAQALRQTLEAQAAHYRQPVRVLECGTRATA